MEIKQTTNVKIDNISGQAKQAKMPDTKTIASQKPKNPFFWHQAIEWTSIVLAVLILAGGGIFFTYPSFQKFQTAPQSIAKNKEKLDNGLKGYQSAAKIIDQYRGALSGAAQELNIAELAFLKNISVDSAQSVLNDRAGLYGASIVFVKERSDLAGFFPDMRVFDIQAKGSSAAISSFAQTFETELPIIWPISDAVISDELHQMTIGLLKEPSNFDNENQSFNEDLYSFSKFRIIKESNADY